MRKFRFLFLAIVSVFTATSCNFLSKRPPESSAPKIFRWAVDKSPDTLQWNRCSDRLCEQLAALSMGGLTKISFESEHLVTEPELTESWEYSRPNEIIFRLRKDVRWTNGDPLVAQDFVRAWKWILQQGPKKTANVPLLFSIHGARAFTEKKTNFASVGISTPDLWTIKVRLTHPTPLFHRAVAHPSYWPLKDELAASEAIPKNVLGRFIPGGTLTKPQWHVNPHSAMRAPAFQGVELQIVPSIATRFEMLENGETDLLDPVPSEYFGRYQKSPRLLQKRVPRVWLLNFDLAKPSLQNREVRFALTQALQPTEWLQFLEIPLQLARGITFDTGSSAGFWNDRFSPGKAKTTFSKISDSHLTLSYVSNRASEAIARNLAAQWRANLEAKIELVPQGAGDLRLTEIDLDLFAPAKALPALLASYRLTPAGRGKPKWPDGQINRIMTAATERDLIRALESFEESVYVKDVIAFPLAEERELALRGNRVQSLEAGPLGDWDFTGAVLD